MADGFTSIVDLNFGPDGTLYATERDEASCGRSEVFQAPTGGTINACAWGSFRLDCDEVATGLPIQMSTTIDKDGTLWTTILSLVPVDADVIPAPWRDIGAGGLGRGRSRAQARKRRRAAARRAGRRPWGQPRPA
ncbi:MAG: hypothetical protein AB1736_15020, partial [Chloroflexota bacterium]